MKPCAPQQWLSSAIPNALAVIAGAFLFAGSLLAPGAASAGELGISVQDVSGKPLADAVVYVLPPAGTPRKAPARRGVMDQVNKAFLPHVLAVETGTTVDFPNSDTINHHVYSFSPAKTFQLRLFKNEPRVQSVTFDRAGAIAMGCNIHDWMLGYIFVVDTPWFAVTDRDGRAQIAGLPHDGNYSLQLWHARLNEKTTLAIEGGSAPQNVTLRLARPLKPERKTRQGTYD